MIGLLLAAQVVAAMPQTSVTYADVPAEVSRVVVLEPRAQGPPRIVDTAIHRSAGLVVIQGVPRRTTVVTLARTDGRYLLDGPFAWPTADAARTLDLSWRRTLAAPAPAATFSIGSMEWVDITAPAASSWPRCFVADAEGAKCLGVADGQRGVAVGRGADRLFWAVVAGDGEVMWRESRWGRLVIVRDRQDERETPQIRFGRPAAPSSDRTLGVRLETKDVEATVSVPIAPVVFWFAGSDVPADSWVEIKTSRAGPAFVPLPDLAAGPATLAATIVLADQRVLTGVIVGARNEPASAALLTMFRLIDPDVRAGGEARRKPRRVFAAETMADDAGAFRIEGLGDAEYEVVAFHPQLGRAASVIRDARSDLTIRLQSPGSIRGRVLSGGKPAAGVEIISVPDPDAFRNADDPLDVKGGDARSGPDGRFTVIAAAIGGGELRIGGGRLPVRRVPLPRVPLPVIELGDIELGAPIEVTIVLDQATPCGVRATGPVGRSGLQIIMATRIEPGVFRIALPEIGVWHFALLCGGEGRPLSPTAFGIGPEHAGKEVRLAIR